MVSEPASGGWSFGAVLRSLAVLVLAGVALWLSMAITIAMVLGARAPEQALGWWPPSAGAKAALASHLLESPPSRASVARASELARAALRREPVNVVASRTLGLTAALGGDQAGAGRLFAYSESLSRRDVPTQMWLIEDRVQHGDIAGALLHYDRALRVSESIRDVLLPIMVQASADPAIAAQETRLVATRPLWWPYFVDYLLSQGRSPRTMAQIISRIRLDPGTESERQRLGHALNQLVTLGAYREAYAIYRQALGGRVEGGFVRNGDFEAGGGLGTFDWTFVDEPDLAAVREFRDGASGSFALSLVSSSGRGGEVARQLVLLPPGTYLLAAKAGAVPEDVSNRPMVSLLCAGQPPHGLTQIRLPFSGPAGASSTLRFVVPATGCPAQWLTISTGASPDEQGSTPWVDQIEIAAAH